MSYIDKPSQKWYDDPHGQYEKAVKEAEALHESGEVSAFELNLVKRVAGQCRDRVLAERKA